MFILLIFVCIISLDTLAILKFTHISVCIEFVFFCFSSVVVVVVCATVALYHRPYGEIAIILEIAVCFVSFIYG